MPVDPNLQPLLDVINGMDGGDLSELSVSEARELLRMMAAVDGEPDAVAELSDRTIPGPAGPIPVRVYRPESDAAALPILVWYHGGGWVIGDLETADWTARRLANRVGAVVVSVDYRLAPEHQFPAAVEDCWAALEWASTSGAEVGGDPGRLAVGGDSAGGNLAAVMAIAARDRGLTGLRYQLLVYPATDLTMSHPSIDENGEGYLLTKKAMVWFTDHYLGADGDPKDVQASPIYTADLSGLGPGHRPHCRLRSPARRGRRVRGAAGQRRGRRPAPQLRDDDPWVLLHGRDGARGRRRPRRRRRRPARRPELKGCHP